MRVLFSGDHHWTNGPRLEECQRVHDWMQELARERECDLFVSTGDLYDGATTPELRLRVLSWAADMAAACSSGAVFVRGNHDRKGEIEHLQFLNARERVDVITRPRVYERYLGNQATNLSCCPWPERAWLLEGAESSLDAENRWRQAFQSVMQGFSVGAGFTTAQPHILAGHFMVDGSVTSTGQPLIGATANVPLEDLALAEADLVVMGHVHKPQAFECGGKPCLYVGSPYATDWGETEEKSVLIATFKGKELTDLTRVPTPARRMVHIEAFPGAHTYLGQVENTDVRLRIRLKPDQRELAERTAGELSGALHAAGAHSVTLDLVVEHEQREARIPELRSAASTADQLEALWRAQGYDPGGRRGALLEKLEAL